MNRDYQFVAYGVTIWTADGGKAHVSWPTLKELQDAQRKYAKAEEAYDFWGETADGNTVEIDLKTGRACY